MINSTQQQPTQVIKTLGYAGLLPFLCLGLMTILQPVNNSSLMLFCYYSTAILCFLAGSIWRYQTQKTTLLIQSNLIVLLAVAAIARFHLNPIDCLFLLALGYSWALIIDLNNNAYGNWYKKMRLILSIVVVALHGGLATLSVWQVI
jgi:hypothetical protein